MSNDAALEQAITALLEERAEIDQTIAALQRRLGRSVAAPTGGAASGPSVLASPGGEIVAHPGEFHQHTMTQAVEKILRRTMRPVKTQELFVALQRAQFQTGSKNPSQSIYTALARHKGFVKVRPNTWALSEWFPNSAGKGADAEPKKRRRRARKAVSKPKLLAAKNQGQTEEQQGLLSKAG